MIIGICGLIGSGKGTVADILVETHSFQKLSFADALKDGVASMFNWPRHMLEGDTDESRAWREQEDPFWSQEMGRTVTPRLVLQLIGTEAMRVGFFDGVWVSIVKQKIVRNPNTNWVLPDTRFPNEIAMLQSIGGQVWRVKRGADPHWFGRYVRRDKKPHSIHPSEWSWAKSDFDQIIENNADLESLRDKVKSLI